MTSTQSLPTSSLDFVKGLPPEAKGEIVFMLLSEIVLLKGNGPIPVTSPSGESFGYFIPPAAAKDEFNRFKATIPAGIREKMTSP